jgi:hypothetical protein
MKTLNILKLISFCMVGSCAWNNALGYETAFISTSSSIPAGWVPTETSGPTSLKIINLNGAPYGATAFLLARRVSGGVTVSYSPPTGWAPIYVSGRSSAGISLQIVNLNGAPYNATSFLLNRINSAGITTHFPPPTGWVPTYVSGMGSGEISLQIVNLNGAPYNATSFLLNRINYAGITTHFPPPEGWIPTSLGAYSPDSVSFEIVNLNGAPYGATSSLIARFFHAGITTHFPPPTGWVPTNVSLNSDLYSSLSLVNLNNAPYGATAQLLARFPYGGVTSVYWPPTGWVPYGHWLTNELLIENLNNAPYGAATSMLTRYDSAGLTTTYAPPIGWITIGPYGGNDTVWIENNNGTPELTPDPNSFLSNLSTRGMVGTGQNVLIGGFVLSGTTSKNILIDGRGPSLAALGVSNPIADPSIYLNGSSGQLAANDDWQSASNASQIAATGLAPTNNKESALFQDLAPGVYTVVVNNLGSGSTGILELFDLVGGNSAKLVNISCRGFVDTGDNVLIAGFIISGGNKRVLINGKGPSLAAAGIVNPLSHPIISLVNSSGELIRSNANWQNAWNAGAINGTSYKPANVNEASIYEVLPPGAYTVVLRGVSSSTGVGLIEIYDL